MSTPIRRAVLQKGWGYWDVTSYPYGGCFNRAALDTEVEITGEFRRGELEAKFTDKLRGERRVVVRCDALREI